MNETSFIKAVNYLLLLTYAFLIHGFALLAEREQVEISKQVYEKIEVVPVQLPEKVEKPSMLPILITSRMDFEKVIMKFTRMETEFIGYHFITSYCPEECGFNGNNYPAGWRTSSGTICHYSEEWNEPTTCAIDRSVHGYNELILVGDPDDPDKKLYITEDCGPGVQGYWIDCFVESMSEVRSWETGWRPCYAVTFTTYTIIKPKREVLYESFRNYLFMRCSGSWSDLRDDNRTDD